MNVPFRKYHGTGNDFAVVEADELGTARAEFARSWCGEYDADGVLFLDVKPETDPLRIGFRLFQPDGSTAEMCGNGARVAARWAMEQTGSRKAILETPAGPRETRVHTDDTVTVDMGIPTFAPTEIPVDSEEPMIREPLADFEITAVNTGVPHAVAFVDDVETVDIESDAPPIRHAAVFPDGANATFARRQSADSFDQRTYERGVEGETQSCGTGAVAIVAVADRLGMTDGAEPTAVHPPGGTLTVTAAAGQEATLRGPTTFEFADSFHFEP